MLAITPLNIVTVGKSFSDKDVRDARLTLDPGEYVIDATMRFKGTMRVGRDYFSDFPVKIDVWGLLAVCMSKLSGVVCRALVEDWLSRQEFYNQCGAQIKLQADEAVRVLKATTNTPCKGRVTAKAVLEAVRDGSKFICHLPPEKPNRAAPVVVDAPKPATSGLFDDMLPTQTIEQAAPAAKKKPARRRARRQRSKAPT